MPGAIIYSLPVPADRAFIPFLNGEPHETDPLNQLRFREGRIDIFYRQPGLVPAGVVRAITHAKAGCRDNSVRITGSTFFDASDRLFLFRPGTAAIPASYFATVQAKLCAHLPGSLQPIFAGPSQTDLAIERQTVSFVYGK